MMIMLFDIQNNIANAGVMSSTWKKCPMYQGTKLQDNSRWTMNKHFNVATPSSAIRQSSGNYNLIIVYRENSE